MGKTRKTTRDLLAWYDKNRRNLPWRSAPGNKPDPYHVWLSEIMLQQTTVATVTPRFQAFLKRWPSIDALAKAELDEVLHEWQGLGYYARARNLHACAVAVVRGHGGTIPANEAALRALPGIGDYTAAAIAAIAFGQVSAPVDGNIIRVISRLNGIERTMPEGKAAIRDSVMELVPPDRPSDFAQAMMDLGAMVCTPRNPSCGACPWHSACRAIDLGDPERFPVKKPKKEKPIRYGTVFWVVDPEGRVLLGKRAEKGLLGGMMEFPSTEWRAEPWDRHEAASSFQLLNGQQKIAWQTVNGSIRHTFTHFHLVLDVMAVRLPETTTIPPSNGVWSRPEDFHRQALPTVMKKVASLVSNQTIKG